MAGGRLGAEAGTHLGPVDPVEQYRMLETRLPKHSGGKRDRERDWDRMKCRRSPWQVVQLVGQEEVRQLLQRQVTMAMGTSCSLGISLQGMAIN